MKNGTPKQFRFEPIIQRLTKVRSVTDLVRMAHLYAKRLGFTRLRFYVYIPNQLKLVSRESFGHDDFDWAENFRAGNVVRKIEEFSLVKKESFWCLNLGIPIVVQRKERRKPGDLQLDEQFNLKLLIMAHEDYRSDPLPFDNKDICVHFPMEAGNRYVGKFCCDREEKQLTPELEVRVKEYWQFCKIIAPSLEMLLTRERNPEPLSPLSQDLIQGLPPSMRPNIQSVKFEKVRASIQNELEQLKNVDQLLDYCTYVLAQEHFDCKYASFFTVSEDAYNSRLLILRRTSYPELKELEDIAEYNIDTDKCLTAYVAKEGICLRYSNLKELESHKSEIVRGVDGTEIPCWGNKHRDSEQHNGYLAVALLSDTGQLLGVLRFSQKAKPEAIFSQDDESLLVRLAREHIAPRLKSLTQTERFHFILERLPKIASLSVQDSVTNRRLAEALTEVLVQCIPSEKGKKRFLVNKLDRENTGFYVDHLGGDLPFQTSGEERINLSGTLTEKALDPKQIGALYVQDFAKAGIADSVLPRASTAKCALACRVAFQNQNYAVLVVISDCYDLTHKHARLLELTCVLVGAIQARRRMYAFELTQMGLGHDFATQLDFTRTILEQIMLEPSTNPVFRDQIEEIAEINRFAAGLLSTYHSPRLDASIIEANSVVNISAAAMINEVIKPAEIAVGKRGLVDVQVGSNVFAQIWQEPVSGMLYNLLKNALAACSQQEGAVKIRSRKRGDWLLIKIANNGTYLSEDIKRELHFDPMNLFLGSVRYYSGGRGYGLYLATRLAMSYKLGDGRHAEVKYSKKLGKFPNEFTLAVPTLAKNQRHNLDAYEKNSNNK